MTTNHDITISPSLLAADFFNLENELSAIEQGVQKFRLKSWLHLDIMDGHFVPNLSFGLPVLTKVAGRTNLPLDIHLMVTNPEHYISELKSITPHNISFHWENQVDHIHLAKKVKAFCPSVGLVINPRTPIKNIPHNLFQHINLLLIMSVQPGFGGQKFMDLSIDKIKTAKKHIEKLNLNHNITIQVDGGIGMQNSHSTITAGATNIVAGTAIFRHSRDEYGTIMQQMIS